MLQNLAVGIVRILAPDGRTAGTGFVVHESGLIATCAHVVWPEWMRVRRLPRPEAVRLVFHASGEEGTARVVQEWWRDPDAEDVAILCLEGPLPEGAKPLPLGSSAGKEGHTLATFGFPDPKPVEGMPGECKVVGRTTERGFPVLQLRSTEITCGFSGSPALDTLTGHWRKVTRSLL